MSLMKGLMKVSSTLGLTTSSKVVDTAQRDFDSIGDVFEETRQRYVAHAEQANDRIMEVGVDIVDLETELSSKRETSHQLRDLAIKSKERARRIGQFFGEGGEAPRGAKSVGAGSGD